MQSILVVCGVSGNVGAVLMEAKVVWTDRLLLYVVLTVCKILLK